MSYAKAAQRARKTGVQWPLGPNGWSTLGEDRTEKRALSASPADKVCAVEQDGAEKFAPFYCSCNIGDGWVGGVYMY